MESVVGGVDLEHQLPQQPGMGVGLEQQQQVPWYESACITEHQVVMPPICEVAFDPYRELVWTGYTNGRISALSWPDMGRYSSFAAHDAGIQRLLVNGTGVISLSSQLLRLHSRGGITQLSFSRERMRGMHALSFLGSNHTTVVMGGETDKMFVLDMSALRLIDEVSITSGGISTIATTDRAVWIGSIDGSLCLRDPRTMQLEQRLDLVFPGGVANLDVADHLLVSCGYSKRMGQIFHDQWVKIYDTRTFSTLPGVGLNAAVSVKFVPNTHTMLSVSQSGDFRLTNLDLPVTHPENAYAYSVESGGVEVLAADPAPSGQWLAFGDGAGVIHQWTSSSTIGSEEGPPPVSYHSQPYEPSLMIPLSSLDPASAIVSEDVCLGSLNRISADTADPDPYPSDALSAWPAHLPTAVPQAVDPINQDLLDAMSWSDFVGYAPNPRTTRRNQVPPVPGESVPDKAPEQFESPAVQVHRLPFDTRQKLRPNPPASHRRMEIRDGLTYEMFDFARYNKVGLCGLENSLPNSYINAMIQVLYFIPQVRSLMLNHLCERERCLSCELGLLFRMLGTRSTGGRGQGHCEARNFLKVFRQIREAHALGLWEPDDPINQASVFLPRMVESLTRFLLELLHKEVSVAPPSSKYATETGMIPEVYHTEVLDDDSPIDPQLINRLFGGKMLHETKCITCGATTKREGDFFHVDLQIGGQLAKGLDLPFVEQFLAEYGSARSTSVFCDPCKAYRLTEVRRMMLNPPSVMCVTSGLSKKEDIDAWKSIRAPGDAARNPDHAPPPWLPESLELKLVSERVIGSTTGEVIKHWKVVDGNKDKKGGSGSRSRSGYGSSATDTGEVRRWVLSAVISHVSNPGAKDPRKSKNLIAYVRTSPEYYDHLDIPQEKRPEWVLFNDFHVTKSSIVHATLFNTAWEAPCVCVYSEEDLMEKLPPRPLRDPISENVLWAPPLSGGPDTSFIPLSKTDIPGPGVLVALDAEFVALSAPEIEDGEFGPEMIKNARLGLGRVSVIRTTEDSVAGENVPFIDDYVHSSEPVVDYLTRFSGLVQGDLDYRVSPHHVVTLKQICAKLRFLVDRGCVFVGHGLKQDFRVINISVPPEQVIDTVVLFHRKKQRKIGLRFLARLLLSIDIQSDVHDSIEDARTAWLVYKEYLRLKECGQFEEALERVYNTGRETNWQVPE